MSDDANDDVEVGDVVGEKGYVMEHGSILDYLVKMINRRKQTSQ